MPYTFCKFLNGAICFSVYVLNTVVFKELNPTEIEYPDVLNFNGDGWALTFKKQTIDDINSNLFKF